MKRAFPLLALCLAGCVSFQRAPGPPETAAKAEIGRYYTELRTAFQRRNVEALATLFDPSISQPMTYERILSWGRNFFHSYTGVRFSISSLAFESVGPGAAVVRLGYRVTTEGGQGDFGGVERDYLAKSAGRWRITAWERLPGESL